MIVNLAEQQGKEAVVTDAYRKYVTELGSKDVQYVPKYFVINMRSLSSDISGQVSRI